MKLPENKKERIQVFVLIGIGVVAVIYAAWQLVAAPFLASKQKLRNALATKQATLEKAERELKLSPSFKTEFDSVAAELDKTIADNVLRPILGSYLVGVTETLEAQARLINLKLDEIRENGIRELPRPVKKGSAASLINFKSYSVQVSAKASFAQATLLISTLEKMNPYLCISDIRISGQVDDPEHHRLSLKIEWPIEAEPGKGPGANSDRGGGT